MNNISEEVIYLKKIVAERAKEAPEETKYEEFHRLGIFNGLEWALSKAEGREPVFSRMQEMKEYKGE